MKMNLRDLKDREILSGRGIYSTQTVKRAIVRKLIKEGKAFIAPNGDVLAYCSISKKLYPLVELDLDHIDGTRYNNHGSNLRLIHCTLHRSLPTSGGKNRHRYDTFDKNGDYSRVNKIQKDGSLKAIAKYKIAI